MASQFSRSSPPPPFAGDPVAALERHEASLGALRTTLTELSTTPSYLMLTNDELEGETRRKVGEAVSAAETVWLHLAALEGGLLQVRAYEAENGTRGRHRQELVRLLTEPWVPVEQTDGTTVTRAVAELLASVRRQIETIQRWVTEIEKLWLEVLPRIDAARTTLVQLQATVDELGVPEPLIGRARALAEDLEQRLVSDPLSVVPADGPQLDAEVGKAATQVASLRSGHDNLEADLGSTDELLARLRVLRARAQAAASEAQAKVVDPDGVVQVPSADVLDGDRGLAARLDGLLSQSDGASWNQRRALLDQWLTTARKLESQLTKAEAANRRPLQRRDELRGRLEAYRAKISATGRAEDLELTALVDEVRNELFTAPTDIDKAAASIDALARRLR